MTLLESHSFSGSRLSKGVWSAGSARPATDLEGQLEYARQLHEPLFAVESEGKLGFAVGGNYSLGQSLDGGLPVLGTAPAVRTEDLGDESFRRDYGIKYAYLSGSMANGIASAEIVEAMGNAGMLGFFGAAGLPVPRVEAAVDRITKNLGNKPLGFNLIHSPHEPDTEQKIVDLYISRGVKLIEASAFLDLTPAVVKFRLHGIHRDASGKVVTPNRVLAKISRVEVASKFFAPAPERILSRLLQTGAITEEQAKLSAFVPVAQDLTAEADSGGHTDNRPAITLLPTILSLRDKLHAKYGYDQPLRVGLAGGIATPWSAVAGFAMGAAFIVGGSIHQACVESGSSDAVREMLAQAQQADTAMCPAADMFEMGVKVQVLKRGTMFAMRASKLYEIYRAYPSIDAIPADERSQIEKNFFKSPLVDIWNQTVEYFKVRDPSQIDKANADPKHQMALIFRWYLGQSSRWANAGVPDRRMDYQVWCGPSMGAFNEWAQGSFLEAPVNRRVVTVARNLMFGAAVLTRLNTLRAQGVPVPSGLFQVPPLPIEEIESRISPRS